MSIEPVDLMLLNAGKPVVLLAIYGMVLLVPQKNSPASRQRWMLYPVYASAAYVCLKATLILTSMKDMREFIGEKGFDFCWTYGNFDRYLYANIAWIFLDALTMFGLYWLARRNYLRASMVVWAIWWLGEPLLSIFGLTVFGLSFC